MRRGFGGFVTVLGFAGFFVAGDVVFFLFAILLSYA